MKQNLVSIFLMCFVLSCISIGVLNGEHEKIKKLTRLESVQDTSTKSYSKETDKKVKATIVQCKKQFTRLFDLLNQAECLEKEEKGWVHATRDLRDFLDNLGAIYTNVIDTITGRDELKKQIEELKKINTRLLITMQEQLQELNERDVLEKNLTHLLVIEKDAHKQSLKRVNELERQQAMSVSILNRLENCSKELDASISVHNHEKDLIEQMLDKLYTGVSAEGSIDS